MPNVCIGSTTEGDPKGELMDVIHNLTGYRFGHMGLQNLGLNQGLIHKYGTEGRNRTGTPVKEPDFESGASTSSATPARYAGRIL